MQLRTARHFGVWSTSLVVAGTGTAHAQAPPAVAPPHGSDYAVHVSSEAAGYADSDHVFVLTPSIAGSVAKPAAGWSVDASYLVDVISAASVDVVSTASRRWEEEVRQAGSLGGSWKKDSFGISATGVASFEPDYVSWAAGLSLSQDLLSKHRDAARGLPARGTTSPGGRARPSRSSRTTSTSTA